MAKKPVDPKWIEEFETGILYCDVRRVKAALAAGVDPATPVLDTVHPFQHLMYTPYSASPLRDVFTEKEFNKKTSLMISLLLEKGSS